MPIIQHLGTAFASGGGGTGDLGQVLDNMQVWLDPRNWSSLSQNSDAAFGAGSISSGNWRIMNQNASYVNGTNNQGVEPSSANTNMCTLTYGDTVSGMNNLDDYSMQLWIYVGTQNHGSWGYIGGKSSFWGSQTAGIFIQSNGTEWGFHTSTDGALSFDMPANGWHNVCGVRDTNAANSRKFYVDGSLVGEDNIGGGNSAHSLNYAGGLSVLCHANSATTSGGYTVAQSGFKFGHCFFYSDALSAGEVLANFNATKTIYGL